MKIVSHRSTQRNHQYPLCPLCAAVANNLHPFENRRKQGDIQDEPDIVGQSCRVRSYRSNHRIGHHLRCEPDQPYGKLAVESHCGRFRVVFRLIRRPYRRGKTEEPV